MPKKYRQIALQNCAHGVQTTKKKEKAKNEKRPNSPNQADQAKPPTPNSPNAHSHLTTIRHVPVYHYVVLHPSSITLFTKYRFGEPAKNIVQSKEHSPPNGNNQNNKEGNVRASSRWTLPRQPLHHNSSNSNSIGFLFTPGMAVRIGTTP